MSLSRVGDNVINQTARTAVAGFLEIYDQLCDDSRGTLLELLQAAIHKTEYREFLNQVGRK